VAKSLALKTSRVHTQAGFAQNCLEVVLKTIHYLPLLDLQAQQLLDQPPPLELQQPV